MVENEQRTLEERVNISLAISRYLRALERFDQSTKEFNEACQNARAIMPKNAKFLVKDSWKHYLVTTYEDQSFNADQIEVI